MTATKNLPNPPIKRPRLNTSPSPNHMVIQNSTNEDNRFKSPHIQSEPKNFKDLNENNTTKPGGFELFKNYYGFPFDDSTLKMMSNSSKVSKNCGRLKQKKLGLSPTLPPGPFTSTLGLSAEIYGALPPFPKTTDTFRFSDETMEAQDLSKVRELECSDAADPDAGTGGEMLIDPDLHAVSASQSGQPICHSLP